MKILIIIARLWLLACINAIAPSLKVKSLDAISAKWSQRASAAGQAYTDGVKAPKNDWASSTVAAEQLGCWRAEPPSLMDPSRRGCSRRGSAWQNGAINKGAQRYAPGVQAAQPSSKLASRSSRKSSATSQLPPRMPKGDPGNYARAQAVGTALRNAKQGK
jgi:hypothetical protein